MSGTIKEEIDAVVRRAFVPKIVAQIYNKSPLMEMLFANANTPKVPSLSSMISDALAVETDPVKLRRKANRNWASIGRKRFERPGGR